MSFPKDINSYCLWMEQMARDHILLRHGEDISGNGHSESYGEVWISSDPMEKLDFSSFFSQLRSKIKYPAMVNLGCSMDLDKEENTHTSVEAMYAILYKAETKELSKGNARKKCYRIAQEISNDINARIAKYMEINMHWGSLQDKITTEPIGPLHVDGPLYGVVVRFEYQVNVQPCYDESKWSKEIERVE